MKLACLSDTCAPPIRKPLRPQASNQPGRIVAWRIAEHRTGVGQFSGCDGDAFLQQRLDRFARGRAVAARQAEPAADEPLLVRIASARHGGSRSHTHPATARSDGHRDPVSAPAPACPRFRCRSSRHSSPSRRRRCRGCRPRIPPPARSWLAAKRASLGEATPAWAYTRAVSTSAGAGGKPCVRLRWPVFQHAVQQDHHAGDPTVTHQQIAAQAHHVDAFVCGNRTDQPGRSSRSAGI